MKRFVRLKEYIKTYFYVLPFSLKWGIGLVLLISGFQILQKLAYHLSNDYDFGFSWYEVSLRLIIQNTLWLILSPLLFQAAISLTDHSSANLIKKRIWILTVFVVAIIQNVFGLWLYNLSYFFKSGYLRSFFGSTNQTEFVSGLFTSTIEGIVIVGMFIAVQYQKKLANKERDLAKAQLNALQMQLHPHFLFNTLHSISSMIDIDVKQAQHMITKVGDLLRKMLTHDEVEFITLKQEIDFIRNYLELEQIRFQDRMKISFNVDENLVNCKVPNLILQPLVENCIKHGVSKNTGFSSIYVKAYSYNTAMHKDCLQIIIENESDQDFHSNGSSFGIGLKNVKQRLNQLYQEDYKCEFKSLSKSHYKSEILIPIAHD